MNLTRQDNCWQEGKFLQQGGGAMSRQQRFWGNARAAAAGLVLALLVTATAGAADLALVHVRAFPSPGAVPIEDATIIVRGRVIASVSHGSAPKLPAGSRILDCTGMSVTAGLWNSHVHVLPVKLLHAKDKSGAQLSAALEEMLTSWGFTTVFDVGSILDNTNNIRSRIAAGEIRGPRILTVGEPFFPQHGIPSYVSGYLEQNQIALPDDLLDSDAVARVRRETQQGADGIKIFAGSVEGDNVLLMPLARATAIAQEAHRLHRIVFAHPSNLAGIEIALDSGVDVLAHPTSDDPPWTPALLQRMRASKMALIPTLTLFDVEVKHAGASDEVEQKVVGRAVARVHDYATAGGEILFGTDVGYIYQFDTSEEYSLMQRAGLDFAQVLASLTTNPARRFGLAERSGRIAENREADLTVFKGNPAADITALSRVRYTIREGKIIYQAPAG
jgi:imidazolonepropionase-like amidohydrolase